MIVEIINQEYYEQVYYSYQVEGRGLLSSEQLISAFNKECMTYSEILGPLLPKDKSVKCIDCACGYGNFLYFLKNQGYANIIGVDSDPRQIALTKSLKIDAIIGNATHAPSEYRDLGVISALDFIEHLDKNTAVKFLESCFDSLLPGGILIIKCPCTDGFTGSHDLGNDLTHRWGGTSNMISQLLYTVGFSDVNIFDPSLPNFPNTSRRKILFKTRKIARKIFSIQLKILGITIPNVWSSSLYAVARKSALK